MASTTGIEIGSSSCTLVEVRPATGRIIAVEAINVVSRGDWPSGPTAQADRLRAIRRTARLPRRAAVVVWEYPGDRADTPASRAGLQYIESAGFEIESILSPVEALAEVARGRRRDSDQATAWTSATLDGAAIAIVSGADLLFARMFPWTYRSDLTESRAVLLQRYTLIAHLAPEVQRGIDAVRSRHGVRVEGLVTCGSLPDLRSLTMPLIEELDLEVETLDSMDGLRAAGKMSGQRLAEAAPAIRLASAAALALPPRAVPAALASIAARRQQVPALVRVGTAVALIGSLAWCVFSFGSVLVKPTVRPLARIDPSLPADAAAQAPPPASAGPESAVTKTATQAVDERGESRPVSTMLSIRHPPRPTTSASAPVARQKETRRAQLPLKEPLPSVDSILIDQDRRLALIGGSVVGVGTAVGSRTIVRIERDAVILREPSGLVVRVPVRTRSEN